jgi:DNA-binding winged helix-turn-helix (wHTH) protein
MEHLLPFIDIRGPDGQQFRVELDKDRITIGRFDLFNDIALEPDPQQLITRKVHCALEHDLDGWWVVDNGSVNRTFLRCGTEMTSVEGRAPLEEGMSICLLGQLTAQGEPIYWELTFHDPLGTRPAHLGPVRQISYLEYDWLQAKLYRVQGSHRQEIQSLRPQEQKLIRYMDQRNRANGQVPVMCTFEELLIAVWGEEHECAETEVNHLVWELRKKLELEPKVPQFLETVRGLGYRLLTRAAASERRRKTP